MIQGKQKEEINTLGRAVLGSRKRSLSTAAISASMLSRQCTLDLFATACPQSRVSDLYASNFNMINELGIRKKSYEMKKEAITVHNLKSFLRWHLFIDLVPFQCYLIHCIKNLGGGAGRNI